MTLAELRELPAEEAIPLLDEYIASHPNDEQALTLRGLRHWALSHRAQAINDYLAAVRINPESPARFALQNVRDILNYYNPDLLNP